jgi:error-prone DNA polymerase
MSYVELHARSAFSFLEGASLPEEIIETAARLELPAVALLDTDNLSGAVRFHLAAKKAGLRTHVGAEVTAPSGGRHVLLAETRTGYQNLCRLISSMKLRSKKGEAAASDEEFAAYSEGLVCLTGGEEGTLFRALKNGPDEAAAALDRLLRIYGPKNVYVELQRHLERDEEERNQALLDLARSRKLPIVAANGVSHANAHQREPMDVLTCVRHKVTIDEAGRLLARNSERHLKPGAIMSRLFADLPEAIGNAAELSARLGYTLADLGYKFPDYPTPGETMASFLRKRVDEGARDRFRPYHERARKQVEKELALIEKLGLPGYFLIVWDIVRFCREQNILAQGRGSAANSAVCYALGITAIDPIKMELLFERFLSEERGEWPDIDIDLPSGDQRERVIQYVYERYGRHGAAMTANIITYRDRSAVRDVGKALGFSEEELNRLSKLIRTWEWKDENDTPHRRFTQAGFSLDNPRVRKFFDVYLAVQDLPRHLGQHSGGMVICEGRLDGIVPIEPATMPGRVVVQWDKEDCADMGIIKVDLLGLGMLALVEEAQSLIRESWGEEVDLAHLPQDDPAVYEALQNADTVGLFQVESRAQMSCLPRLRPKNFYDIVVEVAIIRPGPIVGQMLHPYLRRRQGREPADALHPSLEPVLRRTLGVPLFQEQLLRMAMIAAGFSGGQAEELRRAMGFKRSEKRMKDIERKLREGMDRNGITGETQDKIVTSITSFALYGFPESHAASFALIAYASAYLKCHYLAAFTAAILNNQPMGFYHPATLIKDAQRHGLHFLPVDANRSQWRCTIEERNGEKCVRLGFNYVKGFRQASAVALVAERARALFTSIDDLAHRVTAIHKDELNKLAEIGALNSLLGNDGHRRDALWQSALAPRRRSGLLADLAPAEEASPLMRMTPVERTNADFLSTGVTIGCHPMAYHRARLNSLGVIPAGAVKYVRNGKRTRIAGAIICRQRPGTAKGFMFMSIEDETGITNAIVMPDFFEKHRMALVSEPFLLLEGVLQNLENVVSLKVDRIEPLPYIEAKVESHDFR